MTVRQAPRKLPRRLVSIGQLRLLEQRNERLQTELDGIYASRAWHLIARIRRAKKRLKTLAKHMLGLFLPRYRTVPVPLVTVVIPIYDRVEQLRQSIESVLSQTMRRFEVLLICDGSPPETLEVVESYRHHPKVRIFQYPDNSGNAVRGRNRGLREARGEFLAFHDSDDIAHPKRLARSLRWIRRTGADVVYGAWQVKKEDPRNRGNLVDGQIMTSPDCDYAKLLEVCVPCQSTVMARVSTLRAAGGLKPEMRYMEDYELWLRLAFHGYRFQAIPEVLTTLRLHSGNLELSFQPEAIEWRQKLLEEHKRLPIWKPKIAYLIPGKGISGGTAVICQHVNRLRQRGYEVLLIDVASDSKSLDWFPNQQVEVIPFSQAPANIDIAVATGWQTVHYLDLLDVKRKLYFVQSDETRFTSDPELKTHIRKTYSRPYEYLTEARWIQRWLWDEFGQVATYVPNGLDPTIIQPTAPIEPKGSKLRVLLEGPIAIPFKGMADAFAAVQDLDCEIWCVSSAGKPEPEWRCDRFFEAVPMADMKRIYSSCDILLKMSRVEGFFGPPLEMMACGGCVVVSKVTGYDEYIVHQENALVVDAGDISGAREAIKRLIDDPALRERLSAAGNKTAGQWRWDPTIDALEHVYLGKDPSNELNMRVAATPPLNREPSY